jgi:hypothetical protein
MLRRDGPQWRPLPPVFWRLAHFITDPAIARPVSILFEKANKL